MDLSNFNIVIVGVTSGIGNTLANILIEYGATVIGTFHQKRPQNELIDYVHLDLCDEEEIKNVFTKIKEKHERIDVVINLGALCLDEDIYEKTKSNFMKVLETNLVGTFLICKYASLVMDKGVIINMSSTDATDTYGILSMDYAASKAGVENLTKNLANRLPNLKICALAPNWVDTESVLEMDPEYLNSELQRINQKELIKKESVAFKLIEIIINDDISSGSIIRMGGNFE